MSRHSNAPSSAHRGSDRRRRTSDEIISDAMARASAVSRADATFLQNLSSALDILEVFHTFRDTYFMFEMVKRGFVAVDLTYDPSFTNYALQGCNGIESRARAMFDGTSPLSALTKLCDQASYPFINCDLGVATSGWSQGAQLATLGVFLVS